MTDTLTAVKTAIPHVIGGARVDDDARRGPVFNPATGEQTGEVVLADAARIDEAV
ncbi:MAG: mmsA, partial [Agromyces sp.]|nr:mmsA [Agromyces sp.]